MIDNVNNNLINTQTPLQETTGTQGISASAVKNAYGKNNANLVDESDISEEAVNLYQREQEVSQYTSYLDSVTEEEATAQVMNLMQTGVISVSDEELAESMFYDISLLNDLFAQ